MMDALLRSPTIGEMHELRSRLTAAMLATELLRRAHPHSADVTRLAGIISEAFTDIVQILGDLEHPPAPPDDSGQAAPGAPASL